MEKWTVDLEEQLIKTAGTEKGKALANTYKNVFSNAYQEDFNSIQAADDINLIEKVSADNPLELDIYEQQVKDESRLYLKLFQYDKPIPLSDILPILENMDLRTFDERIYKVSLENKLIWISDFSVAYVKPVDLKLSEIKSIFKESLINIINEKTENDGFNKLILGAGLPWREISLLRAYAKYLHQIGFRYSQAYIEKTVAAYPEITKNILNLFKLKFDPKQTADKKSIDDLDNTIKANIENVTSLDEDRILRNLWLTVEATLRTNYFQKTNDGNYKDYISLKLASKHVPDLPLPHPLYEVFVYSSYFEAIHLRAAKVARGGIRWSDRPEDFRTEILGLMKAQRVKNSIIVPSGAKGGFVLKKVPLQISREDLLKQVVKCYKSFMHGLLDITDNIKYGNIVKPKEVICYDDDDPYLVVAADKGTATFSDIANEISKEYNFWLGDAFASGGSAGYDHKKMGITARGAWESVKRHFLTINLNMKKEDFTVIGIGDMSGDVFGNGMIYSDHIKLIAAFDHRHIFIDPDPDPTLTFKERKRLFELPNSSWDDYDRKLISKGGNIFSRKLKSIELSPEAQKALETDQSSFTPNELIRIILKAPVTLLFNGGIGTYVKARLESHADVGDKTNEFCRINGDELRCKVVGEGGNLGFTQLGRIEYALKGGLINTDFIDNSAGVDCSDHEVNIKILLNKQVDKGKLTEKDRNQLLFDMTDDVAQHVLADNYNQALTMSFTVNHASELIGLYHNYLKELETTGVVDRVVEFLPDDKTILERKALHQGLVSPEIAELLAYTKIHVKSEILKSKVPEDPYFIQFLEMAFPKKITDLYANELKEHPLRREIISTQLSNELVSEMGITFVYRLQTETGATVGEIVRAHTIAAKIFDSQHLEELISSLEFKISAKFQYELLHHVRNLINLTTRWFLRGNRLEGDMAQIIKHYANGVKMLEDTVHDLMLGVTKSYQEHLRKEFTEAGISLDIGRKIAITRAIYTALNIIEVATKHNLDLIQTAHVYFNVGGQFSLVWFRDHIAADKREGHWNTLARLTLRDELDTLQKLLTVVIVRSDKNNEPDPNRLIENWIKKHKRTFHRWEKILELLYAATPIEYSMFFIALRELSSWVSDFLVS